MFSFAAKLTPVRTLLSVPDVVDPPVRVWRDFVLFGVVQCGLLAEVLFNPALRWWPASVAVCSLASFAIFWRRTRPLQSLIVAFVLVISLDLTAYISLGESSGLVSTAFMVVLVYSVARWAPGRHVLYGLMVCLIAAGSSLITSYTGISDFVFGLIFLMAIIEVGILVRQRLHSEEQQIEKIRLVEREQFARDLHDTVAHHISAITIQAQAGKFLAKASKPGALQALEVIEEEASRAMVEMRSMISVLREGETDPELVPQHGVADIEDLAATVSNVPGSELTVSAAIDTGEHLLSQASQNTIYRIAQESITNAVRHAEGADRVNVSVEVVGDEVSLTVADNGKTAGDSKRLSNGYGLVGMKERVEMLGGSLDAGFEHGSGWTVRARLPLVTQQNS